MNEQIDDAGTLSVRVHLSCGERGVAIHAEEMLGEIAIRVMLQLARQIADRAVDLDRLVHVHAIPPRSAAIVEPQLVIGIHVGRAQPAAEIERHARHAIAVH